MWVFLTGLFLGGWLLSGSQTRKTGDGFGFFDMLESLASILPKSEWGKFLFFGAALFLLTKASVAILPELNDHFAAFPGLFEKIGFCGSGAALFFAALSVLDRPLSWVFEVIGKRFRKISKLTKRKANGSN